MVQLRTKRRFRVIVKRVEIFSFEILCTDLLKGGKVGSMGGGVVSNGQIKRVVLYLKCCSLEEKLLPRSNAADLEEYLPYPGSFCLIDSKHLDSE